MRRSTAKGILVLAAATYGVAQGFNSFQIDNGRRMHDDMTVLFADTMSRPGFGGTQQGGFNQGGFGNNINNSGGFGSKGSFGSPGGGSFGQQNNGGPKPFGNNGPSVGQQYGPNLNGPQVGFNQGGSFAQQQDGGNSFPQEQFMGGPLAQAPASSMNGPSVGQQRGSDMNGASFSRPQGGQGSRAPMRQVPSSFGRSQYPQATGSAVSHLLSFELFFEISNRQRNVS